MVISIVIVYYNRTNYWTQAHILFHFCSQYVCFSQYIFLSLFRSLWLWFCFSFRTFRSYLVDHLAKTFGEKRAQTHTTRTETIIWRAKKKVNTREIYVSELKWMVAIVWPPSTIWYNWLNSHSKNANWNLRSGSQVLLNLCKRPVPVFPHRIIHTHTLTSFLDLVYDENLFWKNRSAPFTTVTITTFHKTRTGKTKLKSSSSSNNNNTQSNDERERKNYYCRFGLHECYCCRVICASFLFRPP